jgi:heat-inducible transcriptional repressor
MTDLGFRARRILYAVVTEFISSGEPVGSRKLSRRYGLDVSPATIRNELADLEEAGYLAQPHTSAGRVPTDKGFRAFVEALVRVREVDERDRIAVFDRLAHLTPGVDDIPREAVKLLSSLTGGAAVVQAPRASQQHVVQLRFLPLRPGQLLAVLVTRAGAVENRVVSVEREPDAAELERIHNYLSQLTGERTLGELRSTVALDAERERSAWLQSAHEMVDATHCADPGQGEVLIGGQKLLLDQPDFADVGKMRGVLAALEEKQRLVELLDRTLQAGGVQVLIGAETQLSDSPDLSLIAASYGQGGSGTGMLGVIAPTRVDYQKVVPLVGFAARVLTNVLDRREDDL